jgi:predicted enzyme related to lactoylglutathione lyase
MDMKLELVAVPVTDVDRAKAFYVDQVGFNADHDHRVSDVTDARAARKELLSRRVDASEVEDLPWGSFTHFADPDGNTWAIQQIPQGM